MYYVSINAFFYKIFTEMHKFNEKKNYFIDFHSDVGGKVLKKKHHRITPFMSFGSSYSKFCITTLLSLLRSAKPIWTNAAAALMFTSCK